MPSEPRRRQPESSPTDLVYAAILKEASPIAAMPLALDAELTVSALLGGVYAAADRDRPKAVRQFVTDFGRYLAKRRTPEARAVRAGLAALHPDLVTAPTGKAATPDWIAAAGAVTCTGTWAVRDNYGDQTQYVATFAYDDPERGGPDHAVSYLLDHNLGCGKEVSIGVPATQVVASWQAEAAQDSADLTIESVEPGRLRADVTAYLAQTDELAQPYSDSYQEDRGFALARLRVLPEGEPTPRPAVLSDADRDAVVAAFLDSPEAAYVGAGGAPAPEPPSQEVIAWGARAAIDFACDDNAGDPLRWSPTAVELFMITWMPRQVAPGHRAAPWLPEVLDAYVTFAGRVRGQPATAIAATKQAITEYVVPYTDLMAGQALGEPVTDVLARMVADGVDPMDEDAVLKWVLADRARRGRD
ncbi:MAG: hypothetical protein ACRDT4_14565 [Micromonosporaceae bacterium]